MALSLTTVVLLTIVTLGTVHSYYLRSYSGKRNFNHGENSIKRNQVRQNIALQKKGGHGSHEHGKKKGDKIDKEIETLIKLLSLLKEDEMQEIKENISKAFIAVYDVCEFYLDSSEEETYTLLNKRGGSHELEKQLKKLLEEAQAINASITEDDIRLHRALLKACPVVGHLVKEFFLEETFGSLESTTPLLFFPETNEPLPTPPETLPPIT